jgi:hypothetical protein
MGFISILLMVMKQNEVLWPHDMKKLEASKKPLTEPVRGNILMNL